MSQVRPALFRRLLAELTATALLLIAIVGSGIAAARLSPDQAGLQLLENALATGAALVAIIMAFGPISGAHVNPVVTIAAVIHRLHPPGELVPYVAAQGLGAIVGTALANLMFGLPTIEASTTVREGGGIWLAEAIATVGLLLIVNGVARSADTASIALAVGAYITGAYFFTSSTSFANPAVTLGRTLTDSFAGIAPASAPAFIAAQMLGLAIGLILIQALGPPTAGRRG